MFTVEAASTIFSKTISLKRSGMSSSSTSDLHEHLLVGENAMGRGHHRRHLGVCASGDEEDGVALGRQRAESRGLAQSTGGKDEVGEGLAEASDLEDVAEPASEIGDDGQVQAARGGVGLSHFSTSYGLRVFGIPPPPMANGEGGGDCFRDSRQRCRRSGPKNIPSRRGR